MSDIADDLRKMRGELHVNELRHSGTHDGNIYSSWGTIAAFALIEIERLRAELADRKITEVVDLIDAAEKPHAHRAAQAA